MSTCQPCKLQCASIVYMAIYVTKLQVYKTTRYLLVERCLCIVQASRFLSPSVTVKLLSNAKYMVTFILTDVRYKIFSHLMNRMIFGGGG